MVNKYIFEMFSFIRNQSNEIGMKMESFFFNLLKCKGGG